MVTLIEVIEHVTDPLRLLRAAATFLRPGGMLYLTTPNFNSLSRHLLGASWSAIHPREHRSYFTVGLLGSLLKTFGFAVRGVRTTGLNYHEVVNRLVLHKEDSGRGKLQETRAEIERSAGLTLLKSSTNCVLSLLRLGDTIKVYAERSP